MTCRGQGSVLTFSEVEAEIKNHPQNMINWGLEKVKRKEGLVSQSLIDKIDFDLLFSSPSRVFGTLVSQGAALQGIYELCALKEYETCLSKLEILESFCELYSEEDDGDGESRPFIFYWNLVVRTFKAHVLCLEGDIEGARTMLCIIQPHRTPSKREEAEYYSLKAAMYHNYGHEGCKKALYEMEKALQIYPYRAWWYFNSAKIMCRLRHHNAQSKGRRDPPDMVELAYVELAWNVMKDAPRSTQLARSFQDYGRSHNIPFYLREASKHFTKIILNRPFPKHYDGGFVSDIARCLFGLFRIPKDYWVDKNLKLHGYFLQCLHMAPNLPMVNHYAGLFFADNPGDNREYLQLAITCLERAGKEMPFVIEDLIKLQLRYKLLDLCDVESTISTVTDSGSSFRTLKLGKIAAEYYLFISNDIFSSCRLFNSALAAGNYRRRNLFSRSDYIAISHSYRNVVFGNLLCNEIDRHLDFPNIANNAAKRNLLRQEKQLLLDFGFTNDRSIKQDARVIGEDIQRNGMKLDF